LINYVSISIYYYIYWLPQQLFFFFKKRKIAILLIPGASLLGPDNSSCGLVWGFVWYWIRKIKDWNAREKHWLAPLIIYKCQLGNQVRRYWVACDLLPLPMAATPTSDGGFLWLWLGMVSRFKLRCDYEPRTTHSSFLVLSFFSWNAL
jgi:hypothetical protein